jgi:hypothetical protein
MGHMPMVPSGFVHRGQLDAEVQNAIRKLGPEVVDVTYKVRPDSTGEPAIFFRIVLADAATRKNIITETTGRIVNSILNELRPIENWGLHPFFNYRSQSDQQRRNDPQWA